MKNSLYFFFYGLLIFALTSCDEEKNSVKLEIQGDKLQRTSELYVWETQKKTVKAISNERLKDLKNKLGAQGEKLGNLHCRFVTSYQGLHKNEYDGCTAFFSISSRMGTCYYYTERLMGPDDPAAVLEKDFTAINRATQIVSEWFLKEYKNSEESKILADFIKNDLRQILKNFVTYQLVYGKLTDSGSRYLQYLLERLNVNLSDLGKLQRELITREFGDFEKFESSSGISAFLKILHFIMLKQFKKDQEIYTFLDKNDFGEKSFKNYVLSLPDADKFLESHRKKQEKK